MFTVLPGVENVWFGHRRKSWSKTTLQRSKLNCFGLQMFNIMDSSMYVKLIVFTIFTRKSELILLQEGIDWVGA